MISSCRVIFAISCETLDEIGSDWFSHGQSVKDDPWEIPLAKHDTWPQPDMKVLRIKPDPTRTAAEGGTPPTYLNTETHWWDGSQLYGSSVGYRENVRTRVDGKIKLGKDHLVHPEGSTVDRVGTVASLAVSLVVGLALLLPGRRPAEPLPPEVAA